MLGSFNIGVLGSLFAFGGEEPPDIGLQEYPGGQKGLALCPTSPNCISTTSNSQAQDDHYVPPWTYNPIDGRGLKKPVSKEKAFAELIDVIQAEKPDNFTPTITRQTDEYIHVEYESAFFGFKDDVEFFFPANDKSTVEYRSASRLGDNDFDINRKRIKLLRKALERKGWSSVGYA